MQRKLLRTLQIQLSQKRFYKKHQVRVRFAPSPTGHLHLGGLRTALYNYLYARAHGGTFILRIEDTDQTRVVPGAMEQLRDDLIWAGIIPDEDPIRGGPRGPYLQSKRLELYQTEVKKLLKNESAYHCFCSESRLELLRRDAAKRGMVPKYDNKCRSLTKEEVKEKMNKGIPHCIRFKLVPTPDPFHDLVYGSVNFDASTEADPVILKGDGFPTYHFANVVDDHYMEISCVLRGVEWQISTPKHLLLYRAFGWEPPQFAHLPLILNADGSKLSKRQNDIQVAAFRKDGIFPLALLNYITHAGGGFNRDKTEQKCYSYRELIEQFDVSKINSNSTKLAPHKLLEFNKLEIVNLLKDDNNKAFLIARIIKLVKEKFPDRVADGSLDLSEAHILSTLQYTQYRISSLSDLVSEELAFLWVVPTDTPVVEDTKYFDAVKVLAKKLSDLERQHFTKGSLSNFLREFAKTNDVSFSALMKLLRGILSGLQQGPGVAEMMEILGKDDTIKRLNRSL